MSDLNFSPKTREIIRKRSNNSCEITASFDLFMDYTGEMPADFPKIDLNNELHNKLEQHHCNFKSAAMPGANEDWNGINIYKFYHDVAHGKYIKHMKWSSIFANYCRMVAEGRRPHKSSEQEQGERMERRAKHMEKNSKTRAKNKAKRKENPWMDKAQKARLNFGKKTVKTAKPKKPTKQKVEVKSMYFSPKKK